jgi:hypothetical protein
LTETSALGKEIFSRQEAISGTCAKLIRPTEDCAASRHKFNLEHNPFKPQTPRLERKEPEHRRN